jgi:hypothetical protein
LHLDDDLDPTLDLDGDVDFDPIVDLGSRHSAWTKADERMASSRR